MPNNEFEPGTIGYSHHEVNKQTTRYYEGGMDRYITETECSCGVIVKSSDVGNYLDTVETEAEWTAELAYKSHLIKILNGLRIEINNA